ncbi:hypothetical protein K8Q94_01625 [Candidatus Nomurabacteria bacterium]|nr:hypothetical protein [Candidatus Nomurabacteria bacterium]
MKKQTIFFGIIVILILGAIISFVVANSSKPKVSKYDTFATCLKDQGAVFYGAFWCPHCKAQKAEFGPAVKLLNYIECSNPDAKSQKQICIDKKIESYPTWEFKDGTRLTGEVPMKTLAEKTSCVLPE